MKPTSLILLAVVAVAAVGALAFRPARHATAPASGGEAGSASASASAPAVVAPAAAPAGAPVPAARPRLLNLGAGACVPCRMMEPIRAALQRDYAGVLQTDFIDVWKDRAAGAAYGIRTIPTLIFFAPDGRELHRQEGYTSQEDILARWRALGYALTPAPVAP